MKLSPQTVSDTIDNWDLMYPGKRTDADLALLSGKFYKKFLNVYSDELFRAAVDVVEDEQEFFPTIAHMKKAQNQAQAMVNRMVEANQPTLPEYTEPNTPEEKARAKKRLAIIGRAVKGEITYDQATAELEKMVGYAQQ